MVRVPRLFKYQDGKAIDLYSAISFKIFFPDSEPLLEQMVAEIDLEEVFDVSITDLTPQKDFSHRLEWFRKEPFLTLNFTKEAKKELTVSLNPTKTTLLTTKPLPNTPQTSILTIPTTPISAKFFQLKQEPQT